MAEDRKLPLPVRRAIRRRLDAKIRESHFRTPYGLEKELNLTHSAVVGWQSRKDPITPDTVSLYRLSDEIGFSIDWLLFEIGPDQRGAVRSTGEFTTDLRAQLIAALHQRSSFSEEEVNRFLPADSADALWESIVSHFGLLLLGQNRKQFDRDRIGDYFKWSLERRLSEKKLDVRPFYEVERSRPL